MNLELVSIYQREIFLGPDAYKKWEEYEIVVTDGKYNHRVNILYTDSQEVYKQFSENAAADFVVYVEDYSDVPSFEKLIQIAKNSVDQSEEGD